MLFAVDKKGRAIVYYKRFEQMKNKKHNCGHQK